LRAATGGEPLVPPPPPFSLSRILPRAMFVHCVSAAAAAIRRRRRSAVTRAAMSSDCGIRKSFLRWHRWHMTRHGVGVWGRTAMEEGLPQA
ncbi:unnamed protein product, partial [Urochloa humidicola]